MSEPAQDLVVVRGGTTQTRERVELLLDDSIADGDGAVLSVFCDIQRDGEPLDVTLDRICRVADVPHKQILVSSADRLRSLGLRVEPEVADGEPPNHHHVIFDVPIVIEQLTGYVDAWDGPVPNPTGGRASPR